MRYALLVNERPGAYEQLGADELAAITAEYVALVSDERVTGAEQLHDAATATTVREQNGGIPLTDGPFADTKEIFGGFYLLEAGDLNEARVLASLVAYLGDFELVEDATQEAFATAGQHLPRDGLPDSPVAWLTTTARNRAIDRLRRERMLEQKTRQLDLPDLVAAPPEDPMIPDERLELIFTCCHPALATEAQVALTLRALGGLSTPEIARAFVVSEETMKRRLSRARTKIKTAGIPFEVPADHVLPDRLRTVFAVVYLIFNQGYSDDRRVEAIRLGRVLTDLAPDEPEATALMALMRLHDARRDARVRDGEVIPLHDQDRTLWDAGQIATGCALAARAMALRGDGPYTLQAAIATAQVQTPID